MAEDISPADEIFAPARFQFSDITDIVQTPRGYECRVKFDLQKDYVPYLASPDDTEPHGRGIYAACDSGYFGDAKDYFPDDAELREIAGQRIDAALSIAHRAVTLYQDRIDIADVADPSDPAQLLEWKRYRVALSHIPEQPGYPLSIVWPHQPVFSTGAKNGN